MKVSALDLNGQYYELTDSAHFYERFVTGVPGSWQRASRRVKHRTQTELMCKLANLDNVYLVDYRLKEQTKGLRELLSLEFPNMTPSQSIRRENVYELVHEITKMASASENKAFICVFRAINNTCNMVNYWQVYDKSDYRKLILGKLLTQLI